MSTCIACGEQLPEGAIFCHICGRRQVASKHAKRTRGNGMGTVYKVGKTWAAEVTLGFREVDGVMQRVRNRKYGFRTKKEALEYLPTLQGQQKRDKDITWQELYRRWLPSHHASPSTIACYRAAENHFRDIEHMQLNNIELDDLQDCVNRCDRGKTTRTRMKVLAGLLYKYAIPRELAKINLAQYLIVSGEASIPRESFTDLQMDAIRRQVGKIPHAEYILCMCYLGFRAAEFFALDVADYDRANHALTGGAKTEAGKNRIVTISPKILPYVELAVAGRTFGPLFCDSGGEAFQVNKFRDNVFYPTIQAAGIDNPVVNGRHKYSPHSCRHTFATMMKRVEGADRDKLELIGHANVEMLRYYQGFTLDDLRKITDQI